MMGRKEPTDEEIVSMYRDRKARRNARDRAKRALREAGKVEKPGPPPDEKKRTQAALALFGLSIGAVKKGADGVPGTEPATRKEIAAMLKIKPAALRKRIGRLIPKGKGTV